MTQCLSDGHVIMTPSYIMTSPAERTAHRKSMTSSASSPLEWQVQLAIGEAVNLLSKHMGNLAVIATQSTLPKPSKDLSFLYVCSLFDFLVLRQLCRKHDLLDFGDEWAANSLCCDHAQNTINNSNYSPLLEKSPVLCSSTTCLPIQSACDLASG